MKNYRDKLIKASPPMVPFLRNHLVESLTIHAIAIYLKDLTFINDGNADKVKGMINIEKLRMMANRVEEIVSLGGYLYPLERNEAVMNWLQRPLIETDIKILKQKAIELEENL